ncbi:MAG: DUF4446 family protein [Mycobacteriales bacterium]
MQLDPNAVRTLAIFAAFVAVIALGMALTLGVTLRKMHASYAVLQGGKGREDFVTVVNQHSRAVEDLRGEVEHMGQRVHKLSIELADALRHVAVVRYDAFPDMGGRLSFSVALLDDSGDGLVLTSINGRSETRTYAKGVKANKSDHQLSPEESQAISYATRGPRT